MSYRAVWCSAHQLVLEHCDNAPLHAAMNADEALAQGELDRYRFWLEVVKAIADTALFNRERGMQSQRS